MNLGVSGYMTCVLRDIRTNNEEVVVEGNNLILNDFLDYWFTSGVPFFSPNTFHSCYIGNGRSLPVATDLGLSGSTLAVSSNGVDLEGHLYDYRNYDSEEISYSEYVPYLAYRREWLFAAGQGSGIVSEVAVATNTGKWFAKKLLEPEFHKSQYHELRIVWEIRVTNNPIKSFIRRDSPQGLVVHWQYTNNDYQLYRLLTGEQGVWFGYSGSPQIIASDSNTQQFPINNGINGSLVGVVGVVGVTPVVQPYAVGSSERTFIIKLESGDLNGDIGELILDKFARITFVPLLDKNIDLTLDIPITIRITR